MASSIDTILLNGTTYSLDQLPDSFEALNAFEQSTLQFCYDWKKGKKEFILTTSGSTGKPRSITILREQMIRSAHHTAAALGLRSGMTALVCLDTNFIAGRMMLVRGLEIGMKMIAINPSANPFEAIEPSIQLDFAAFIPYQLETILKSTYRDRLNSLQATIIGGAPLETSTREKLKGFQGGWYATYGMTETVSHIALQKLNGTDASDRFKSLPGVTLSVDERGCLVIEANFVENGKVITNDLVNLHQDDEFTWLGRWDNIINSGGIKIHPEEIEEIIGKLLESVQWKNRFFIDALPDEKLGQKMVMIIEGDEEPRFNSILEMLKMKMEAYKSPKELIWVPSFVETKTGKINRKETMRKIPCQAPPNGGA